MITIARGATLVSEPSLEQRILQLEELFMHQQNLVQQLNEVAIELRNDVDSLSKQLKTHGKQLGWLNQNTSVIEDREEKPPHY
jgi:uncharacterized coiled-coil protein SlyX